MDWILSLIPGGGLTALFAGAGVLVAALTTWLYKAERSGVNKQKAKEAEAHAKDLAKIRSANDARPSGGVLDDPWNRDRRK